MSDIVLLHAKNEMQEECTHHIIFISAEFVHNLSCLNEVLVTLSCRLFGAIIDRRVLRTYVKLPSQIQTDKYILLDYNN